MVILFYIAIILCAILFPIGLIVRLFFPNRKKYFWDILLSIDQMGNVVCGKLFDLTLVKGHYFGDEDETISSAIGRAKLEGNLTILGKSLDWFLNLIDKNHSIKSIEK
jgi:hypothetical protein